MGLDEFKKKFNNIPDGDVSLDELKEFQKQLKESVDKKPVNVKDFEKQIKQPPQTQKKKVEKSLVLSFVSDATGCGHIRNVFPMTFLNGVFGKTGKFMTIVSPVFITQTDIIKVP